MGIPSYHAKRRRAFAAPLALVLLALISGGCASRSSKGAEGPPACRNDAIDDVEVGARTGVAGAKTGATTAVEGVKTFGSATAGLVEGGTDEAKTRWKQGAAQTKQTAHKGSEDTKEQSGVPQCK
jgi:hypothetical protein